MTAFSRPTPQELLAEFTADWEAALRPSARELLDRCAPERRDELADLLDAYLTWAPTPPYSEVQRRRLAERVRPIIDACEPLLWPESGQDGRSGVA